MLFSMTQIYRKTNVFLPVLCLVLLSGCSGNPFKVDVSDVEVDLEIERFEKELFEIPQSRFLQEIKQVKDAHPDVMAMYVENMIGLGSVEKDTTFKLLEKFIYDRYWQEVYDTVKLRFGNFSPIEKDLTHAFKHWRYYFPERSIPDIYTVVKGIDLRYKTATYADNLLAISLDMYLGKGFRYYPSQYPDYRIKEFEPRFITPDVMETWFMEHFPEDSFTDKTLLSKMIYAGKKQYFLKSMLPEAPDSLLLRYSPKQLNWCRTHEDRIWEHFLKEELLFETEHREIVPFLEEAPFTNAGGIPPESPPRLGEYIGKRIVFQYMEQKDLDLKTLMNNKDYQKIMDQSAYNP